MANGKKTLATILLLELCGSKVSIRTGDTKTCPGYYLPLLFYFCLVASEKNTWNFLYEHFWCRRMKYITAHHKSSQEWRQNSSVHYKSSNFKYIETSKISYNLIQLHPSVFNKRNCIFNSNINLISAILKQFKSSEDKGSICDWNLKKKKITKNIIRRISFTTYHYMQHRHRYIRMCCDSERVCAYMSSISSTQHLFQPYGTWSVA